MPFSAPQLPRYPRGVKLIIHAEVKQPFDPSDCKWTDDCCALHKPTGYVFDMVDGDLHLVRTEASMPTLRDVILAARAAQIFMEEVPYVVPHKSRKRSKKFHGLFCLIG